MIKNDDGQDGQGDGNNRQESDGNNINTDEIKTGDLERILEDRNSYGRARYVGSVVQDAGNVVQDLSDDLLRKQEQVNTSLSWLLTGRHGALCWDLSFLEWYDHVLFTFFFFSFIRQRCCSKPNIIKSIQYGY